MGAPGFDDAPMVRVSTTSAKAGITLVYPYYENPQFLAQQLRTWREYPTLLKLHLRVIVVDDGSPQHPAEPVIRANESRSIDRIGFPIQLFRIGVDVRWNWLAARNIGMHHAPEGWCLLTDMDHVAPWRLVDKLVYGDHKPGTVYRLSRREHDGRAIHPHPNSMFMERSMFWRIGGYDEALSGHYGTDGDWRRRIALHAPVLTLVDELVRHEYQGDSSTTGYLRKQPQDAGKKKIIAKRGPGWRPQVLSFPYHEVVL